MELSDVAKEVAQEYASSLADLTVNSKPLINMLTMLAEENAHHASAIVQAVEEHLQKVQPEYKLPVLYLIDSIVKNVGHAYTNLFTQNIVSTFCGVFEQVDERTRSQMFKLRHTWSEMFPSKKLYAMDVRVTSIDPAWPVTAPTPSIHINPKFLGKKAEAGDAPPSAAPKLDVVVHPTSVAAKPVTAAPTPSVSAVKAAANDLEQSRLTEARMREELLRKQKELLELQQKKIELELLQAKTRLEEQQRQMMQDAISAPVVDSAKAQQLLLASLQAQQLNAAKILAEQKAKIGSVPPAVKLDGISTPATVLKTRTQAPCADAVQTPSIHQQTVTRIPKFVCPENKSDSILAETKPKTTPIKPIVSVSTLNKDFKLSNKEIFLNKDPRTANKRISPVPKSMAMLATQMKDRANISSHAHDSLSATVKPNIIKQKPPSPIKVKKPMSPMKSIPEIPVPPPIEVSNKLSSTILESKSSRVATNNKPSGQIKKDLGRIPKKSSSSVKSDRSPKSDRSKVSDVSKYSDSPSKRSSLSKSHKEISKTISKDKKGLDSKKKDKDRKREAGTISNSKSAGSKSKTDLKSGRAFKDTKSFRSRNYMRRNRSISESPEPPTESGDVDLRTTAPSEKIPRINVFKDEPDALNAKPGMSPPGPPFQIEGNRIANSASPDDILGKDVDLRQLPTSPVSVGKKRSSSVEKTDHPSPKKSKAEMIDVLFGNEDVDLRQLGPPISMDVSDEIKERKKAPNWAGFKEVNPDTYKSPLKNSSWETSSEHGSLVSETEIQPPPPPKSTTESLSLRVSPLARSNSKEKPAFDRLGRPLLYNKLSIEDPRERRPSISSSIGEDTDMRQSFIDPEAADDGEPNSMNINIIISQADEQLNNGTISISQYNTLLKQMVHLNEVQKLREAQRRDEQEGWGENSGSDGWDQEHTRSDDDKDSDKSRDGEKGSPRRYRRHSKDEDHYPKSSSGEKFASHGDIDERLAPHTSGMRDAPLGRGRGRGGPSHAPVTRPWPENIPTGHPGPGMGPGGPHPHWEEPVWPSGPHPRQMGPRPGPSVSLGPPGPPGPGMPPHHMHGPRPQFGRGRGDFGPCYPQWPQQQQPQPPHPEHFNQGGPFPYNGNRYRQQYRGELPPVDARELEMLEQDSMKTINIDNIAREIRYYGDTAIIMMKWDDPRELSFQAGTRRVIFNDCDSFPCVLGDKYHEILLDGMVHSIRLGAPTRELFIDGRWYECFFGGPPITVELKGKRHKVQLDGPPPQVKIGHSRRTDLVAGKINLIIDARHMVPIYLDPKPQKFAIDGKPHILRFVEAFRTAIINCRPFRINFGGLPMPIMVRDQKHFVGFSALPPGIRPGYINITNMEGGRLPSPPPEDENSFPEPADFQPNPAQQPPQQQQQQPQTQAPPAQQQVKPKEEEEHQGHMPAMPMIGSRVRPKQFPQKNRNSPVSTDQNQQTSTAQQGLRQGQLDVLSSLMPGAAVAAATGYCYQVQQEATQANADKQPSQTTTAAVPDSKVEVSSLNINELLQKLVATGILPSGETTEAKKEEDSKVVKPVNFTPESLKLRQAGVFTVLYSGIQCSSCGVRFTPEQTMKYSEHLNWHFRQNRRERDSAKKAQSRKWYYDVSDWIQFEEIEDLEERAQSWFETQVVERPEEREQELLSVPAGENSEKVQCAVCHENFEQFYNEDKEEWHLRDAIRDEDKTYHPVCYEDYKSALEASMEESMTQESGEVKTENDTSVKEENSPAVEGEDTTTIKIEDASNIENKAELTDIKLQEEHEKLEGDTKKEISNDDEVVMETVDEESIPTIGDGTVVVVKEEPMDTTETEPIVMDESVKQEITEGKAQLEENVPVKVKIEPVDTDEDNDKEMMDVDQSSNVAASIVDNTSNIVTSSIDGNVELEETAPVSVPTGKIKINITKIIAPTPAPAPVKTRSDSETSQNKQDADSDSETSAIPATSLPNKQTSDDTMDSDVLPPGEDTLHLKPRLVGRKLTEMPPVFKGKELSGLCSIM